MIKHLLTIALVWLLSAPALMAQTFEFRYHGAAVADGATVTIAAEENYLGELACETNPSSDPNNGLILSLLAGGNATGTATLTIEQNTLNPSVIQWCLGGTCSVFGSNTSLTKNFSVSNGMELVLFDASNFQNEGVLLATLTATIGSETHSVKIKFTNGETVEPTGMWWGYFVEQDVNAENFSGYGVSDADAFYEAAIRIGSNNPNLGNSTVKAVRLWFKDTTIPKITSLKIWFIKTLKPNAANSALYVQEVDVSKLTAGANDIVLTTPYQINNLTTHIGYTIELNGQDNAVMYGGEWETNSFWFRASKQQVNWQAVRSGKLAMQLLVDGAVFPDNAAVPYDFGTHYLQKDDEAIIPVTIKNKGMNPLSSISYTITTDGDPSTTTPEVTVAMNNTPYNTTETINVSFDTSVAMNCTRTITITKVNGVENEASATECVASGQFVIKAFLFTRIPVVEEFTGTWCGWCPRGFTAMEILRETYGDNVVLIAAHNGDPMAINDYNPMVAQVGGFPSSFVNRESDPDPHPATLLNYVSQSLNDYPDGMVSVAAQWDDEAMTSINIETDTKFAYGMTNANYGVALVVTNDGMRGPSNDSNWAQANNYNSQHDSYLDPYWYGKGSKVYGLTFNFVAVAAWNLVNGFDGSVNSSFEAGESMKFNYLADIASKNVIQDKSLLKVIALLIDRSNGHIINAAHTTIKPYGEIVPGDVNGDGVCTSSDITALYNHILYNDNNAIVNGDQNGDGVITSSDVTAVYNILLGFAGPTSENVYVVGEVNGNNWGAATGVKMNTTDGKVFTVQVTTSSSTESTTSYFALTKALASADDKWEDIEDKRFGPTNNDPYANFVISDDVLGQEIPLVTTNWRALEAPTGKVYNLTVDLEHKTLVITKVNR